MAPPTTTIKKPPLPPERGTLLSFFKKETTSVRTEFHVSHTQVGSGLASVKQTAGPSKPIEAKNTSSKQSSICRGKEKETQKGHNGSAHDPVVISDDDEDGLSPAAPSTRSKRRKISASSSNRNQAPERHSHSPCRPFEAPPMFAGYPEFKPPPTWPQVVNTADVEEDGNGDIMMVSDEDGARTQDPEEGEIEEDDSGVELDDHDRPRRPEMQDTQSGEGLPAGEWSGKSRTKGWGWKMKSTMATMTTMRNPQSLHPPNHQHRNIAVASHPSPFPSLLPKLCPSQRPKVPTHSHSSCPGIRNMNSGKMLKLI